MFLDDGTLVVRIGVANPAVSQCQSHHHIFCGMFESIRQCSSNYVW